MKNKEPRNSQVLKDFVRFCGREENRDIRFWQSIYVWTCATHIKIDGKDPWYWEGKKG